MTQNKIMIISFSGPILIGLFLIMGLVPLFGYISAKETTEMPEWPEYFQSGLRVPDDSVVEMIINEEVETEKENKSSRKSNKCPEGNCNNIDILAGIAPMNAIAGTEVGSEVKAQLPTSQDRPPIQPDPLELSSSVPPQEVIEDWSREDEDEARLIPFSEDPITREMENELIETGLLSRHAEITESIFLMEQQLKQAQLIIELMEILGPDLPIEISPGQFKNFSNTPAGNKIASELAVEKLKSRAEIFDLEMKVLNARKKIEEAMKPLNGMVEHQVAQQLDVSESIPVQEPKLREIIGGEGNLQAIFSVGEKIISLNQGDKLPSGEVIIQITEEFVELDQVGETKIYRIK